MELPLLPTNPPLPTASTWSPSTPFPLFSEETLCFLECPSCSLHTLFPPVQGQVLPVLRPPAHPQAVTAAQVILGVQVKERRLWLASEFERSLKTEASKQYVGFG